MHSTTLTRFILIVSAIFSITYFCIYPVYADNNDVVIIVNKNAPDKDLSMDRIKQIYTGKITMWSSNESIVIAVLDNDDVHKAFLDKFVKRNPSQFKNTWRQLMFTGKAKKPKSFSTIEELIGFVSNNRLAIGYITKNAADDKVQIITQ